MKTMEEQASESLLKSPVSLDWGVGGMSGEPVRESAKTLGELKGIFLDEAARARMDADTEVYRVRWWKPGRAIRLWFRRDGRIAW
jgi:hypothetical protein